MKSWCSFLSGWGKAKSRAPRKPRGKFLPGVETLEDRRVPAALMHDVALVTASTADSRGMTVDNNTEEILMQLKNVKILGYIGRQSARRQAVLDHFPDPCLFRVTRREQDSPNKGGEPIAFTKF